MGKDNSTDRYRIGPGTKVDLSQWDPQDKSAFPIDKDDGQDEKEKQLSLARKAQDGILPNDGENLFHSGLISAPGCAD